MCDTIAAVGSATSDGAVLFGKNSDRQYNSFLLADPHGAKVLETVDREWVVTEVRDYYAVSNAMTIEKTFEASSATLMTRALEAGLHDSNALFAFKAVYEDAPRVESGCYRRARAMELLGARNGRLEPADFFQILRDHKEGQPLPGRPSGPRICAHTRESPLGQTTASWVASLVPGKIVHWMTGTAAPCTGLFKPVLLESGLPDHGPKPGAEEEADSLWWRHEQIRRCLDEGDRGVRNAFTEERNALEARFLKEMCECPAATDAGSRAEAGRIVGRCWQEGLAFEGKWFQRD